MSAFEGPRGIARNDWCGEIDSEQAFSDAWLTAVLGAFAALATVAVALAAFAVLAQLGRADPYAAALILLVFGSGQYGAWVALVGQATNDVEASQYGVASGIFKTSTHIGSALAVAIAATVIDSTGQRADAYALAFLSAAALTLAGAVVAMPLLGPAAPRTPHSRRTGRTDEVSLAFACSHCLVSTYARRFAVG